MRVLLLAVLLSATSPSENQAESRSATPCDRNRADAEGWKDGKQGTAAEGDETTERPTVVLSENAQAASAATALWPLRN
jgi:hypothetical protein